MFCGKYNNKNMTSKDRCHKANQGFTLVEVSISMVIISFILVMGATLIPRLAYDFQEGGTYRRVEVINRALSAYAQKHNRIPCPANPNRAAAVEPYGTERGSGVNGQNAGTCNTVALRHGIIPFRTLGLNYDDIHDSFGNLFTYRVSENPTMVFNPGADRINNWCRTEPKWSNGITDLDPDKAAFCCGLLAGGAIGSLNNDTQVEGPFGPLPNSTRQIANHGGNAGEYSSTAALTPTTALLLNTYRPSYSAYTIISHGPNGIGSYDYLGTQRAGTFLSADEQNNANPGSNVTYVQDNTVDVPNGADPGAGIKRPLSIDVNDDIVIWRSPYQIYSNVGNASCAEARQ